MQTSTLSAQTHLHKKYLITITLLCLGYFVDFYDLTIFSASYTNIIQDLFNIHDKQQIQLTYLNISNFYTAGIILGSIIFGILGDKFGRITVIRYSILLYSFATLASIIAHSMPIFILLRFLAGAGLATEFATSNVLIHEILPPKLATRYTGLLYFCGILGGITATFVGSISWQIMFLCGGIGGILLYIARKKLFESTLYIALNPQIERGNLSYLFNSKTNLLKTLKLFILITPFYFLISVMFIFPGFMPLTTNLGSSIKILLIGFFLGNLVSTIAGNYIANKFHSYKVYLFINIIIFAIATSIFSLVSQSWFFYYSVLLGLLGGGLPSIWIQIIAKSYGTNQRSTATNTLYALGRSSSIGFNLLISAWVNNPKHFTYYSILTTASIVVLVVIALIYTEHNYTKTTDYLED